MDNVIDLGRLWLIVRRNITLMAVLGGCNGCCGFWSIKVCDASKV